MPPCPTGIAPRRVSLSSLVQNQVDGFLRTARCAYDEPLVALQDAQPVLDVGRAVAEAAGRFKADVIHQCCRAYLCDELFLAVVFRSEEGRPCQPVQPGGTAVAVRQFVEDGAVILCGAHELLADGEDNFIGGRTVEGAVTFFMGELHAFATQVVIDDILRGCQRISAVREGGFGGVFRADAFALVNVEHVVIP